MKRKTFLKSLVGAAAIAAIGLPVVAQATIKIGEINHYKRMAAFAGPYKLGIEMALEEVNAAGGVLGKPMEFIFRDDQGKPGQRQQAVEPHIRPLAHLYPQVLSRLPVPVRRKQVRSEKDHKPQNQIHHV